MSKVLQVAAIENGTVIDHIPAGIGVNIVRLLNINTHKDRVTMGFNLSSRTITYKDIIKIEGRQLTEIEKQQIAIFAPSATLNIIENYQTVAKIKLDMPESISDILQCANDNCITRHDNINSEFSVFEHKNEIMLQCTFCERIFARAQMKECIV